ncbi:MAG TPA: heterodisulfide reductase-related iron-sulfur binding cluster [Chthoniobacterales bacterium]
MSVENSPSHVERSAASPLRLLDYSILQQCMHCGMCLPTCPTYDATKIERNSPRGRISLMRAIADGALEPTKTFAEEMQFCLGCLACETACPAGVNYTELFETARATGEQAGALDTPLRRFLRTVTLSWLFQRQSRLRFVGRLMWLFQVTGLQSLTRTVGIPKLLPEWLRNAESKAPLIQRHFSPRLIREVETPRSTRFRVGLLTGCVQDLVLPNVNRDTADALLANRCEVVTPHGQGCCGSLHAHNGDPEGAKAAARKLIDAFPLDDLDAIITNAGGCGSHLKHYDHLLADDPVYAEKAARWTAKVNDISEFLVKNGCTSPPAGTSPAHPHRVTYHESCHLCHGQKITSQPRQLLKLIPGLELVELPESTWCCGSAGIYNLTQPEMATRLQKRKVDNILSTRAQTVASANPGCTLHIAAGLKAEGSQVGIKHPVTLLAEAYRRANLETRQPS